MALTKKEKASFLEQFGFANEAELNESVKGFRTDKFGSGQAFQRVRPEFVNNPNARGAIRDLDEEERRFLNVAIIQQIRDKFKQDLGRDASDAETKLIFDEIGTDRRVYSPTQTQKQTGGVQKPFGNFQEFLANPKGFLDAVENKDLEHKFVSGNIVNVGGSIRAREPQFQQVTLAKEGLKRFNADLSDEDVSRIISSNNLGEAEKISNSLIKSVSERSVREQIAGLPASEKAAIDALEQQLQSSQQTFFTQNITPSVVSQLNARGLLNSGDLVSALAGAAGKQQRGIQDVIAPLRFASQQNITNKSFENTLRGALESGQNLTSAVNFVRNQAEADRQRSFTASQAQVTRDFQQQQFLQQQALQLALAGGQRQGTSALDAFLQFGLPAISNIGGQALGGFTQAKTLGKFLG